MSRYINTDTLEQHKFVSWTVPEFFDEKSREQQVYQLGWNNAIEAIMENEPTADVRENIRGEWKAIDRASGVWACSVCGWSVILHSGTPLEQHCNFCTNCGAEMQNEKQELVKDSDCLVRDLVNEPRADEWSIDPRELEEDYLFLWEDVEDE